MKLQIIQKSLVKIACVIVFLVLLFSCQNSEQRKEIEVRLYDVRRILYGDVESDQQEQFYQAYMQSVNEWPTWEPPPLHGKPRVERALEILGFEFCDHTSAWISPRDGNLWIEHTPDTLATFEGRFGVTSIPWP